MEDKKMSMFDKVNEHDNDIKEHRERIGTLEEITLALKESDSKHDERLKQLEDNAVKLENTIMIENRDTRTTMKEQTDRLFVLVEKGMDNKHEQKMAKINMWANVLLKFFAVGGIGYLIIQHFIGGN